MCFAPQRHSLFRPLNFQKWSGHGVFCTFWFPNVLRATTACNFSSLIWRHVSAPAVLASLLFDPPETQISGKTQCFATFLLFRAPESSFFLPFLFSIFSDLLSSALLFSGSSHLCFSSVHIVGSLTSKFPSLLMFSRGYFGSCEAATKCRFELKFLSTPAWGVVASNGVRLGKGKGYGEACLHGVYSYYSNPTLPLMGNQIVLVQSSNEFVADAYSQTTRSWGVAPNISGAAWCMYSKLSLVCLQCATASWMFPVFLPTSEPGPGAAQVEWGILTELGAVDESVPVRLGRLGHNGNFGPGSGRAVGLAWETRSISFNPLPRWIPLDTFGSFGPTEVHTLSWLASGQIWRSSCRHAARHAKGPGGDRSDRCLCRIKTTPPHHPHP